MGIQQRSVAKNMNSVSVRLPNSVSSVLKTSIRGVTKNHFRFWKSTMGIIIGMSRKSSLSLRSTSYAIAGISTKSHLRPLASNLIRSVADCGVVEANGDGNVVELLEGGGCFTIGLERVEDDEKWKGI